MTKDTPPSVGYGRPPVHTRFKPGQCGNPNGRPKKRASLRDDLAAELDTPVPAGEGSPETITCQRALAKKLTSMARDGNMKALSLVAALFAQEPEEAPSEEPAAIDDEILRDYREEAERAALPAPASPGEGDQE
jgi:hypothetical protein